MAAVPVSVAVSTVVPTDPAHAYALVADITRMGDWSPETVRARWLDGATSAVTGARFKGTNRLGKLRWSTKPTITVAEPGSEFAFKVPGRSGAAWSYQFEPVDGGTRVTESVSQSRPLPWLIRAMQRRAGVTDRNAHLREGMTVTLQRISAAARTTAVV